jgi:hypothetical protein
MKNLNKVIIVDENNCPVHVPNHKRESDNIAFNNLLRNKIKNGVWRVLEPLQTDSDYLDDLFDGK